MSGKVLSVASVICLFLFIASEVQAQEILLEGPLAGAPAVRKLKLYRDGRFHVGPAFAITILDDYRQHFLMGLKLGYDFLDWLGVGAVGQYALGWNTPMTDHIVDYQNKGLQPTTSNFPAYTGDVENQIGKLQFFTAIQVNFTPLRGKIGLFESVFTALDAQIFLGLGIAGVEERASCSNADGRSECGSVNRNQGTITNVNMDTQSRVAFGPTFGVAFTGYINDWMSLAMEYRATPFPWNISGTDERGSSGFEDDVNRVPKQDGGDFPDLEIDSEDQIWYFNHMIGLSYVFIFPLTPDIDE